MLLCWVLSALGHRFVLEQPAGGMWRHLPFWRFYCKYIAVVFRQAVWMRQYGSKSLKRTFLWSNCPEVKLLDRGPITKAARLLQTQLAVSLSADLDTLE